MLECFRTASGLCMYGTGSGHDGLLLGLAADEEQTFTTPDAKDAATFPGLPPASGSPQPFLRVSTERQGSSAEKEKGWQSCLPPGQHTICPPSLNATKASTLSCWTTIRFLRVCALLGGTKKRPTSHWPNRNTLSNANHETHADPKNQLSHPTICPTYSLQPTACSQGTHSLWQI